MSEIARYVAGFLFHKGRVLLVRKSHPKWQENMMNGVGGGIEGDESERDAMRREFHEEAGMMLHNWQAFAVEHGPGYEVHFFRCTLPDGVVLTNMRKINDVGEDLEWRDPMNVKYPFIGNLNWLLPLAMDPRPIHAMVETTGDIRKLVTW